MRFAVGLTETFSSLPAATRAATLVDSGRLEPLDSAPPQTGTLWVGRGAIQGHPVLLAITDGHVKGGTIGIDEARALTRLTTAAAEREPGAVIVCWDTGGVRVQDGPAALATVAAIGVALTRLALQGVPVATVISGPRGCFGAPAVIAATAHVTVVTAGAHWGLTGPKLLDSDDGPVDERLAREATSASQRLQTGQVTAVVPDAAPAVRAALARFLHWKLRQVGPLRILDHAADRTSELVRRLHVDRTRQPVQVHGDGKRRRDLFRYSFRGHWQVTGPEVRGGLVDAAWGELDGRPAMGIIIGRERSARGIGIEDADTVTRMVRFAVEHSGRQPAPIVTFLFCRGHANDLHEERVGLPSALAECLKSLIVARLLGHPLLCVLGGGAYGAAYLSLAAPSHRILAIRGTTVAPMAPRVLAAFRALRGIRHAPETPQDLAELIPEIRIVESVVRLPRVLHEEWTTAAASVRPEIGRAGRLAMLTSHKFP